MLLTKETLIAELSDRMHKRFATHQAAREFFRADVREVWTGNGGRNQVSWPRILQWLRLLGLEVHIEFKVISDEKAISPYEPARNSCDREVRNLDETRVTSTLAAADALAPGSTRRTVAGRLHTDGGPARRPD